MSHERYVIGTWVRAKGDDGDAQNLMSLRVDYPAVMEIADVTDQGTRLIADGHQCVFRVKCNDAELAALEGDRRYTVFPVDGEATLSEKLALKPFDERIDTLPTGAKREQIKDILVEKFRLQGLERLADEELARAVADEERLRRRLARRAKSN